jgi:hypothetical protein
VATRKSASKRRQALVSTTKLTSTNSPSKI